MKKIFAVFTLFAALIFVISCGGGSSKPADGSDTGETVTDEDSDTADSGSSDNDPSDSGHENPDTAPDGGDTAPDSGDSTHDGGDTAPDNGDTEPDNDYPQTPCDPNPCSNDANSTGVCTIKNDSYVCGCNSGYIFDGTLCIKSFPECSPASETPCIDSATGLIWSAKSASKMLWNDAVNYCQNLTEGDFNDWRLPSIAVLKTLVQNCYSAQCTDDYTGKYSKFGDTVYLWSSSESEDSTAQSIYFSDASTQAVSIDTNINVRCVRREAESRESNCTGLIENSVWNTATQITQTWDWETAGWTPSPEGSYNTVASSSECRFKCEDNYFWNGSSHCLNPCEPNPCNSIGETGTCIGKSANEYRCECEDNYFWNDSSHCLNPCNPNPCEEIANSIPSSCNPSSWNQYSCGCESGYYWWGSKNECVDKKPLTLGNICTGQTTCYNASSSITCPSSSSADFFGQDAQYTNKCTAQSFSSSSNVVIDNNTGLTWEKSPSSSSYTWANRNTHCNDLNSQNYGGRSNWRVPNPLELLTIVDNSTFDPATNSNFKGMPTENSSCLWTNNEYKGDTSLAYYFSPSYGGYGCHYWNHSIASCSKITVLCVSGEEIKPAVSSDFTTSPDGKTVTDSRTGLMWQKEYATDKSWQQALAYCQSLNSQNYAGYSDWRLPNKNELASLVNYEKSGSPYSYFPDMPNSDRFCWSSSTLSVTRGELAWYVYFGDGNVNYINKEGSEGYAYVRCVR